MFRRLIAGLIAAGLITVIGLFAFLEMAALNPLRQSIAADLVSDLVKAEIEVEGDVDIALGQTVRIDIKGMSMRDETPADNEAVSPGEVTLAFPLSPALTGEIDVSELTLSNVHIVIDGGANEDPSDPIGRQTADFLTEILSSPLLGKLSLAGLKIERINDPAGWDYVLIIDKAASSADAAGDGLYDLDLAGSLNGQPFTLDGHAPDLNAPGAEGNFDLTLAGTGHSSRLFGHLRQGDEALEFTGGLDSETPSIGKFLEGLALARVLEGVANGSVKLDGRFDRLAASGWNLDVKTEAGASLEIEGAVKNFWDIAGIDLKFDAKSAVTADKNQDSRLDFGLREVSGHVTGELANLIVDDVVVETRLAALSLAKIGPISVGGIKRSPKGLLQLTDVRLVEGDAKDPVLDLSGEVRNALKVSDWTVSGKFNIPMAGVLTGDPGAGDVGRLRGTVTASDKGGHAVLDELDAHVDGTRLIKLTLNRAKSDRKDALKVDLDIPDIAALDAAVGGGARRRDRFGFNGEVELTDDALKVKGNATVGDSRLDLNLKTFVEGNAPLIVGAVHSPNFHLSSLPLGAEIGAMLRDRRSDTVKMRKSGRISLDLAADAVEGGKVDAGALKAHLDFSGSQVSLTKLALTYLGASISGAVDADLKGEAPTLKLDGKVRSLQLDQLAKRLGRKIGASGPLNVDIDVASSGESLEAFAGGMTGKLNLSLFGGRLASDTIDLAGQNIIGWMFSRDDNGAPLVCFVADFDFKNGVGAAHTVVLETAKVQVAGGGKLDLKAKTLNFVVDPRPLKRDLAGQIGPVSITGPVASPNVKLTDGAVAGKVLGDTVGLPLQIIGSILGGVAEGAGADGPAAPAHKPCEVIATTKTTE